MWLISDALKASRQCPINGYLEGGGWELPGNFDALASENYYIPAGRHPGQLYCCDVITVCHKMKNVRST